MRADYPICAHCGPNLRTCRTNKREKDPPYCPTIKKVDIIKKVKEIYKNPDIAKFALVASRIEGVGYCKWTRVEEIIRLCKEMGYRKLGIATCMGLIEESSILTRILESHGFDVVSISCKTGSIPKEEIGIKEEEKVHQGEYEAMCNPIAQAEILNSENTQFNILMGLCVGHDSLLLKYSRALTTVLVTKDRVLMHNPVAALYGNKGYYKKLFKR